MFEKILVPLDGSPLAESILPYMKTVAKALGSRVTLLHAAEASPVVHRDPEQGAYTAQTLERIRPLAEGYLERVTEELRGDSIQVKAKLVQGEAAEQIVDFAEDEGADLIAMSTHGRSGLARWVLGSTAERVLRSVDCPLLLVRPREEAGAATSGRLSRIVVPLDGSPAAETILPFVQELARGLELEITLIQVIGIETTVQFGPMAPDTWTVPNDVLKRLDVVASGYLAGIAKELEHQGLSAQWEVLRGPPAHRVVDFAREMPDCLVAMTTHGRSGFRRWVMGSVADHVVRNTGEPVLVVRARRRR